MDFKNLRNTIGGALSSHKPQLSSSSKTQTLQQHQPLNIRGSVLDQPSFVPGMRLKNASPPPQQQLQIVNNKQTQQSTQKLTTQKAPVILDQQSAPKNVQRPSSIPQPQVQPDQKQIKDLERQMHLLKQENEDLRVNLKINKELLQSLLIEKDPQEKALIQTINVISSENMKLQMQIERMKVDNESLKTTIIVQTGRAHQGAQNHVSPPLLKEIGVNTSFHLWDNKSSNKDDSSVKKSIKPKGVSTNVTLNWEKEEAFRENERTLKKLMVECARLQAFMKSLLENYSLPENLQEDIRELVYEQEMTQYDQNNQFFAQLHPLSPISDSRITLSLAYGNESQVIQKPNLQVQSNTKPRMNFQIPKLDLTKIKPEIFEDEINNNQPLLREAEEQSLIAKDDSNLLDDNGMDFNELLYMNNPALMMSTDRNQNQQYNLKNEGPPSNTQALKDELADLEYDQEDIEDQLLDEGGQFIYGTSGAMFSDADIFDPSQQNNQEEYKEDNRQDTLDLDSNRGDFYYPDQLDNNSNRYQNNNNENNNGGYYFQGPQSSPSKSDRFNEIDFHS